MGPQIQRLTTPRSWGPEAVQADSAWTWKLTMSFPRPGCSSAKGFRRLPPVGANRSVWTWQPKTDPERHSPLCPQLSPSGRPLPWFVFGAGSLMGPNPNINRTSNRDPPPKVKPASIPNPGIELPSGTGPYFSPRGRSQDWSRFGTGYVPAIEHPPRPGLSLTMAHHG